MARYALSSASFGTPQAMSTSYKTLWSLTSSTGTLRRAWIYDVMFGADGTPADHSMVYKLDRQTDVGTGTAGAAVPLDAVDLAASIVETCNNTVEPTVTGDTEFFEIPVNQRASYRWVAAPGGELVVQAVDTDGIGARAKSPSGYTGTAISSVHFWE